MSEFERQERFSVTGMFGFGTVFPHDVSALFGYGQKARPRTMRAGSLKQGASSHKVTG